MERAQIHRVLLCIARIGNLILFAFLFSTAPCVAKPPPLTRNERVIGELMLSHDHKKLERALRMIYSELDRAPKKSRPYWLSLAGLCELELAAKERPFCPSGSPIQTRF